MPNSGGGGGDCGGEEPKHYDCCAGKSLTESKFCMNEAVLPAGGEDSLPPLPREGEQCRKVLKGLCSVNKVRNSSSYCKMF